MADYTKWVEKAVAVPSLLLDAENPRIPPSAAPKDQRALIAELVEHDDVLDLVRDISENGYAPTESLIGLEEDGRTIILEGNRRLAALKLLLSPDSAPESIVKKVRTLAQSVDESSIRKVRVLYAPSREAAAPLIMQKHTRNQIEKWSPVMQARFYRKLADGGLSAADLARRYGSTPGEVAEFLRLEAAYAIACRIELPEAVRVKVHDPRTFPVSTLRRFLEFQKAREALGVTFDEHGAITGTVHPDEFRKGLARILSDIATEKLNTRTINTKADVEKYLDSIKAQLPNKKKKGTFTAEDFEDKTTAPPPKPTTAPKKTPAKSRASTSVIPHGVKCSVNNARIRDVFTELKGLKLAKNLNASAVMFRILLELSIGHYMDKTKKIQPLLQTAQGKNKGQDWYPTLRLMLAELLKDPTFVPATLARRKLNMLLSVQTSPLSLDGLDSYVHNRFSPPTERELRSYWDTFEDLLAITLDEPPPPTKGASPASK